ncbi:hypothetical protein EJ03DRAFT_332362 [Teratosphaeria nubilosa]|uniref:Uncharacterized protein n=1 Tax=Teratosphaeria nubilosa TaxID=161662 RepID=A0A6G1KTC2_9PEZI|nr:hypothetical protein EJ03DRAFT_332362 [Teratosphaeria nubilosa]
MRPVEISCAIPFQAPIPTWLQNPQAQSTHTSHAYLTATPKPPGWGAHTSQPPAPQA